MWSKIMSTNLANKAKWAILLNSYIDENCLFTKLHYHNIDHVYDMYKYLEQTEEPYSEALDWAVLFHDVVYDELPDKELRSAQFLFELWQEYKDCDENVLDEARELIMHTKEHIYFGSNESSAIIRADLHALTNSVKTFHNFSLIMHESIALYGIDEIEFSKKNEEFMTKLHSRIEHNKTVDKKHFNFYSDVQKGIISTIALSKIVRGLL